MVGAMGRVRRRLQQRGPTRLVRGLAGSAPAGTVVLIGAPDVRLAAEDLDGRTVVRLPAGLGPRRLARRLLELDPIALVVDDRPSAAACTEAWRRSFLQLVDGGRWVVTRTAPAAAVRDAARAAARRTPGRRAETLRAELSRSVGDVADLPRGALRGRLPARLRGRAGSDRGPVAVTKDGRHLVKLRYAELELLERRCPDLGCAVLARVPAATVPGGSTVTSYGATMGDTTPLEHPPLQLRHYTGPVDLYYGAIAVHDGTLLPESFRWHLRTPLLHETLVDGGSRFARFAEPRPTRHLAGSYYYFDYRSPGHYGHLLTEAVSKLWGWPIAKEADPDLKLLCWVRRGQQPDGANRRENVLLRGLGIGPEDIEWVSEPVTVESLVGCSPMWHNAPPYVAHPGVRDVWRRLGAGLPDVAVPPAPRIFVTRSRGGHRECRNLEQVEEFFAARGFTVLHPGGMDQAEQAAVFRQAEVVAGFGGTGMFNMVFSESLRSVIVLNHTAYDARNEVLMAQVHGADAHYFWSPPEISRPDRAHPHRAFQSAWTFELERHRADLESVIARLP